MLSSFVQEYYNILFIFQLTTHKEAIIAFNKYSKQIRKQIRKQHEKYYLSYYILLIRKTFNKQNSIKHVGIFVKKIM